MAEQIERQLTILYFLEWRKSGLTEKEIYKRLCMIGINISIATLRRDIDNISLAEIPIYEEKTNGIIIYKLGKYKMDNLSFSFKEIISLYLLKDMISPLIKDDIWKKANTIIDTIISKIPKKLKNFVDNSNVTKVIMDYKYLDKVNTELYKFLYDSVVNRQSIEIKYSGYGKETTLRRIDPYKIIFEKGTYYLIAYCHLRNEIRNFKVTRIKDVKITKYYFDKVEFDIDTFNKNKFINLCGNQNKEYKVKIRFKGDKARFLKEYDSEKASKIESNGEDAIFYRTVGELEDIKKWVLSYGSNVEVLEPIELRNLISNDIKSLYEQYKK
ncbi:MAG: WYL domain-containing protein [Clostridiales bacterium]